MYTKRKQNHICHEIDGKIKQVKKSMLNFGRFNLMQ